MKHNKVNIKQQLIQWAEQYHTADFILNDPVQFPHRYTRKQDIEISGLFTAILSFGNRKQIIKKAEELDLLMNHQPYAYLISGQWREDFPVNGQDSFYRMLSYANIRSYWEILDRVYRCYPSLEDALLSLYIGTPIQRLCCLLGVSEKSPQKKLNMFLRWMIRQNSPVDFGLWTRFNSRDLLIPLDTHVCRVACELGLVQTATFSLSNARKITQALAEYFPDDPCYGDFALFGYGVNQR